MPKQVATTGVELSAQDLIARADNLNGEFERMPGRDAWLREQIAFAIFNAAHPPAARDRLTLRNIADAPEIKHALGDGSTFSLCPALDWRLNRDSFLALADVAIAAFKAADADGWAYEDGTWTPGRGAGQARGGETRIKSGPTGNQTRGVEVPQAPTGKQK